jgi:outer membrane lipoprotein
MAMKTRKTISLVGALLVVFVFIGCTSYVISKQYREEAVKDATVPMVQKDPQRFMGKIVIWGGRIIDLINDSTGSQLIILESKLDNDEYPLPSRFSQGRFIAKTSKFLDPAIFIKGHRVTLAGEVVGTRTEKLGNGSYTYPEIKIEELRYWVPTPYYMYYPHFSRRWWDPWPYYDFNDDFFFGDFKLRHESRDGRWEEREEGHHHEGEKH